MTIIDRDDFTKIIQFSYGPYTFEILANDDADADELVQSTKKQIDLEVEYWGDYTHSDLYVDEVDYKLLKYKTLLKQMQDEYDNLPDGDFKDDLLKNINIHIKNGYN